MSLYFGDTTVGLDVSTGFIRCIFNFSVNKSLGTNNNSYTFFSYAVRIALTISNTLSPFQFGDYKRLHLHIIFVNLFLGMLSFQVLYYSFVQIILIAVLSILIVHTI